MKELTIKFPAQVEKEILSAFKNPCYTEFNCAPEIMLNRKFYMIHDDTADEFLTNLLGLTTDENLHVINTMVFNFSWQCQRWQVAS